jgi:lysozyme family protein
MVHVQLPQSAEVQVSAFDECFAIVVGIEGVLSLDKNDPGNYTPAGVLKGTKYGISARAFPDEDIVNLTLDRAKVLAKTKYWDVICGDKLPGPLALLVFDASFNQGSGTAASILQMALEVTADGDLGPATLAAVQRRPLDWLLAEFATQRVLRYVADQKFKLYAHSWVSRSMTTLMQVWNVGA